MHMIIHTYLTKVKHEFTMVNMEAIKLIEKTKIETKGRYVRLTDDEFAILSNYAVVRKESFASYAAKLLRREIERIKRAEAEKEA